MLLRSEIIKAMIQGEITHSGAPPISPETHKGSKAYLAFMEWADKYVRPCSIDLRLGQHFWLENPRTGDRLYTEAVTDLYYVNMQANIQEQYTLVTLDTKTHQNPWLGLGPGRWCLAHSIDTISIGPTICAKVATRSTAGRFGVCVRRSAGLIDPGYKNPITFEIHNDNQRMVKLFYGYCYAQLMFWRGDGEPTHYDGHYNDNVSEWTPLKMLPKPLTE